MQFSSTVSPISKLIGTSATLWVINFEVERFWHNMNPKNILGPSIASGLLNLVAPEQHVLCISRPQDVVILRNKPDPKLISYLQSVGLAQGTVYSLDSESDSWTTSLSELVIKSSEHLSALRLLVQDKQVEYLTPFGTTNADRQLAETLGLSLSCASDEISERVNSKTFSHRINQFTSYNTIPGIVVRTIAELKESAKTFLTEGEILIKDPMGVSGKGIKRISSQAELENYLQYLDRRQFSTFELLVEKLLDKKQDFNAQILVTKGGEIQPLIVKTAITKDGKHLGHVSGVDFPSDTVVSLLSASHHIGKKLYAEGFYGIAGHDAIQTTDGKIYPNLEINARLNQSSLQWVLDQALQCNNYFWFGFVEIPAQPNTTFANVIEILSNAGELFTAKNSSGFLPINSFTLDKTPPTQKIRLHGAYYLNRLEDLHRQLESIATLFESKGEI